MNSKKDTLIIFQKNLQLGKAKTRIAASVGNEMALDIYKSLISFTQAVVNPLEVQKIIFYSDYLPNERPDQFESAVQVGQDLGDKMANAFDLIFKSGSSKCVLIGSDCGQLTTEILGSAFEALEEVDVTLGPARDGGYYLIGMKQLNRKIFEDITWSTNEVAAQTILRIKNSGLSYRLLPELSDVDTFEDWLDQKSNVINTLK